MAKKPLRMERSEGKKRSRQALEAEVTHDYHSVKEINVCFLLLNQPAESRFLRQHTHTHTHTHTHEDT